jgi:hypothetical protein
VDYFQKSLLFLCTIHQRMEFVYIQHFHLPDYFSASSHSFFPQMICNNNLNRIQNTITLEPVLFKSSRKQNSKVKHQSHFSRLPYPIISQNLQKLAYIHDVSNLKLWLLGSSQPLTIFSWTSCKAFAYSLRCNSSSDAQIHIDAVLPFFHHKFGLKPVV